jgi:phospholipid/cholesterol/gamma-HCH transport system substrate-binding protein
MRVTNLVIGTTMLAAIAAAFVSMLTVQKIRTAQQRSPLRVVIDGSALGLRRGGPVNFDGVPAGQITSIKLESPRKIVAMVMLDNSAPIRKDTVAGIEFQGLTGVAAISLVGGAPSAPPVPLDSDGIPILTADLSEQETMTDTLHNVDRMIVSNQQTIHDGLLSFETYTASLSSKADTIGSLLDTADTAFDSIERTVTRVDNTLPGFSDGKADELFEKMRSLREIANTFKQKSAAYMEDGRRTLLDISQAADQAARKFGGQAAAAPPAPPRRQPQQSRKRQ